MLPARLALVGGLIVLTTKLPAQVPRELPSVEAILQQSVEAAGGRANIERHTSRIMKGTYALPTRNYSTTVEFYAKAPNRFAFWMTGKGSTATRGFNGTVGWSRDFAEEGLKLLEGPVLDDERFEADFYQSLHWRDRYPTMTVTTLETMEGRATAVVAASAPDGRHETMFFDVQSGDLVRRDVPRYRGFENVQVYFDNYRAAGDVRLPFTIRIVRTDRAFMNIFAFETITHDARIDDARFEPPRGR